MSELNIGVVLDSSINTWSAFGEFEIDSPGVAISACGGGVALYGGGGGGELGVLVRLATITDAVPATNAAATPVTRGFVPSVAAIPPAVGMEWSEPVSELFPLHAIGPDVMESNVPAPLALFGEVGESSADGTRGGASPWEKAQLAPKGQLRPKMKLRHSFVFSLLQSILRLKRGGFVRGEGSAAADAAAAVELALLDMI